MLFSDCSNNRLLFITFVELYYRTLLIMAGTKDFFIKENIIDCLSEDAYNEVSHIIEDVGAFARTTYQSVYVIDYYHQDFLYVADNPLFLYGKRECVVSAMCCIYLIP